MSAVSIQFDPQDPAEVETARQVMELFSDLSHFEEQHQAEQEIENADLLSAASEAHAAKAVAKLWPRLGTKLRLLMIAAADLTREQGDYTIPDLAARLDENERVVVSWRANLGRSVKAVGKLVPNAPPFFQDHQDEKTNEWRYSMTPSVASAVLEQPKP